MDAGQLRHRVSIQAPSQAQDSVGQPEPPWTTYAVLWGYVEPLSGREYFTAQQFAAEVTTRITVRYRRGIVAKMRAVSLGVIYDIRDVIDVQMRHRELQLMCFSGVSANG